VHSRFQIRAATRADRADLHALARFLNTVNLPDDVEAIGHILELSEDSFTGRIREPRDREYVFILTDTDTGRTLGTSMVIAQLGRPGVPYIYLNVDREEKYSATLHKHFDHQVLSTRYSYNGPTEIGGLVVHPDSRNSPQKLGTLISFVRFLFIAIQRADFQDVLLAELLPPLEPDGTSHLWEALGRHFTELTYSEADRLSKRNKEFIRSLFPEGDVYATLLPPRAQAVIGAVGEQTRGVEKLLRRIGFRYANRVDPFDGGPHFTSPTDEVTLVRAARRVQVASEPSAQLSRAGLIARRCTEPPYFCAFPALADLSNPEAVLVSPECLGDLADLPAGDTWFMPIDRP